MAKYRCGKCGAIGHNARSCKGKTVQAAETAETPAEPTVRAPSIIDAAETIPAETKVFAAYNANLARTYVLSNGREASAYQARVFDFIANGTGHGVVVAVPGSGKTTTIVEAAKLLPSDVKALFVAFNKSIALELGAKLPPNVEAMTLHSFGLKACQHAFGRVRIDGEKGNRIARAIYGDERETWEVRAALVKCGALCKGVLVSDADGVSDVMDAFELDHNGHSRASFIANVLKYLDMSAADRMCVDFDDMIWFVSRHNLNVRTFSYVFVDETQDMNAAQLDMVRRAGRKGRVIAVGDPRQAIYAFRGADSEAINRIIAELSATVLPLSVCYRCAPEIVKEASLIEPSIESFPGIASGTVRDVDANKLTSVLVGGDFVVSRLNAPLVSLCFRLLAAGRPAYIQGRDVGASLTTLVKKSKAADVDALVAWVDAWAETEIARLAKRGKETQPVEDRAACMHAICDGKRTIGEVTAAIEMLFSDAKQADKIRLSSTHKAKGLEAPRVYVLRDTYRPERGREEENLLYVAITRAQKELVYVTGKLSD